MIRRLLKEGKATARRRDTRENCVVRVSKIRTGRLGGTINHAEKSAAFRGFINQLLGM